MPALCQLWVLREPGRAFGADKIAAAIEQVLGDPAFTAAARRLATAIAEEDAAESGVDELLKVVTSQRGMEILADGQRHGTVDGSADTVE